MNDSKTYTISEDLYKAILEAAFFKGCISASQDTDKNLDAALKFALKTIRDQQYIYED